KEASRNGLQYSGMNKDVTVRVNKAKLSCSAPSPAPMPEHTAYGSKKEHHPGKELENQILVMDLPAKICVAVGVYRKLTVTLTIIFFDGLFQLSLNGTLGVLLSKQVRGVVFPTEELTNFFSSDKSDMGPYQLAHELQCFVLATQDTQQFHQTMYYEEIPIPDTLQQEIESDVNRKGEKCINVKKPDDANISSTLSGKCITIYRSYQLY
ncbi:hypothetical protein STEG23_021861, partial [Scotinomys teguina]